VETLKMPHYGWIKKMYLCTKEFYSATKKNEILSFAGKMDGTGEHHYQ
jgi:hypothetical protein